MEPTKIKDINIDTLDRAAREWEEEGIGRLARDSIIELGQELREKRVELNRLEAITKIRAMRLHYQHGASKKEVANLLGLELKEVQRWLK